MKYVIVFSPTLPSGPSWSSSHKVCLSPPLKKRKKINHTSSSDFYRSHYLHWSRELVSSICGIFLVDDLFKGMVHMITMLTYIAQMDIGEYKKPFKCPEKTLFSQF